MRPVETLVPFFLLRSLGNSAAATRYEENKTHLVPNVSPATPFSYLFKQD